MADLTEGREWTQIVRFAFPMLIGNVFQQMYNIVDSVVVGRYIGIDAMAAVTVAGPIMRMIGALIIGLTTGFCVIIGQYIGQKNEQKAQSSVDTSFVIVSILSIIVTVAVLMVSRPVMVLMKTPEEIMGPSLEYLNIITLATIFMAGYYAVTAILRGVGDSVTPLMFLIFSTIMNIILDLMFVIWFKMGVAGVAYATAIAQAMACILGLIYMKKSCKIVKFRIKGIELDPQIFYKALYIGIPSAIQQALFSLNGIVFQRLINGYGTYAIAAFGACSKVETLLVAPTISMSGAIATFTSQNIGAGKTERIKKGLHSTLLITVMIVCVIFVVLYFYAGNIISIFNDDKNVINLGIDYFKYIAPFYFVVCTNQIYIGAMQGAGDTIFSLVSSVVSWFVLRLPIALFLMKYMGINGIWLSQGIAWCIVWFAAYWYYQKGYWKKRTVV